MMFQEQIGANLAQFHHNFKEKYILNLTLKLVEGSII